MFIDFPKYVEYKYFYSRILRQLCYFMEIDDPRLDINLEQTTHITPSVVCDLLCFFKYQYITKGGRVFLLFGNSTKLRSYLEDSGFFYQAEAGSLFNSDIVEYQQSSDNIFKSRYTNKINRIQVPNHFVKHKIYLPDHITTDIYRKVEELYRDRKQKNMSMVGLSNQYEVMEGFAEIVENAFGHSYCTPDSTMYYSFQNYRETGIHLACSDIGPGFYETLASQVFYTGEPDPFIKEDPKLKKRILDLPISLKLFSKEEYISFRKQPLKRNLAGILECMLCRLADDEDFGFPYMFRSLILNADGELTIHSEYTLIKIDKNFLYEYFNISQGFISGYNKEKLRNLVLNSQTELLKSDIIRFFDWYFPGVHMSVHIGRGERND